jgi:hypothetical protein
MGIGSFALACLLAVGAGAASEEWHMNQTQFKIPIRIKPELQADIAELHLYCSRDEGRTWNQVGRATPDKDAFLFTTNGDGKYWFKVAVVNQKGVQEPSDVYTAPVGQKIVVDTIKPEVRAGAERQGDQVNVGWEINEQYPRPETLKVEYHTSDAPDGIWSSVPITAGQSKVTFKPDNSTAPIVVRVQIEDMAGNLGGGLANLPGTAAPVVQTALPPPAAPPSSVIPTPSAGNTGTSVNPTPPFNPVPLPRPGELAAGSAPAGTPAQPFTASTGNGFSGAPLPGHGALPRLQLVNKSQVRLDYEVAKLGPSGVGSVDVYVTADEGQTWDPCPVEAAPEVPAIDPRGTVVKGGVLVQLPRDEVVYGFYMVVKSRAGLGKPPPKRGDAPQIRIERDTIAPAVHWLPPKPDPNRRDTLLLGWEAADRNLTQNPVTLEWAEDPNGTWHPIGNPGMPNTGHYAWQVPADLKQPSVYLRVSVRDAAGNVGVHQTEQPELVDLSVPEITITGVASPAR